MIDELEQLESLTTDTENLVNADTRIQTAAHYLKGLHWCDRPTDLMPKDAQILKAARRFYNRLSEHDQQIIDSFSDRELYETINPKHRNRRFQELAILFSCQMGMESRFSTLLPPKLSKEQTTKTKGAL